MEDGLHHTIKFALIGMISLLLLSIAFIGGFISAHVLASVSILSEPETATPTSGSEATVTPGANPTPTPMSLPAPRNEDEETFQLFWEVWDLLQRNYYGELPDMKEVTFAAIRGMLVAVGDPYNAFIEPTEAAIMAEDATGEYEGIGAWIGMSVDGRPRIEGVFEDGPAERAGLQAGDYILQVDGTPVAGLTLYEVIAMIRGPEGTSVTLLISREGEPDPLEFTITRARLETPVTEAEMLEGDIGYIRLYDFSTVVSGERVEQDLESLLNQGAQSLILDLRGNPGGQVAEAVEIADLFLDDGVILIERWKGGRIDRPQAHAGEIGENIPLVVLVDRNSASASEILAGALQDHGRAILIGETTFGKGVVQRVITLENGGELWVVSARWFTPNDRVIGEQGLKPDIEVLWPEEPPAEGEDPQLERAVEYLRTGE